MRSTAATLFLVLILFVSGCRPQVNAPAERVETFSTYTPDCSFFNDWEYAANTLEESPKDYKPVSWKTYSKIYSVPAMEIAKISIHYLHLGLRSNVTRCFEIVSSSGVYMTSGGSSIEKEKIQNIANSLINLRLSSGIKYCMNHFDDGPMFHVAIEYQNGRTVNLFAASNCTSDRSPWNVTYQGKSYFQSTGEIPEAVYGLIESFDKNIKTWWQPELAATGYFSNGSNFSLVSHIHPVGTTWFSEMDLIQDHMKKSRATAPYGKEFKLGELELNCPMQTDCSAMDGKIGLTTDKNNVALMLDIHFDGDNVVVSNPVPAEQLLEVQNNVLTHPYLQRTGVSDTKIEIKCWMERECKEKDWCSGAFDLLGRSSASEELICSTRFDNGEHRHLFSRTNELYFLPTDGLFWVKGLGINLGNARPSVSANSTWKGLDVSTLTDLFITEGYPNIVKDLGNVIEVGVKPDQCNFVSLDYSNSSYALERIKIKDPGFMGNLSVELTKKFGMGKISTSEEMSQVFGYCVFISPDGKFLLFEP